MERFQVLWREAEKSAAPREVAHAQEDQPSTVKAAERISETLLDRPLPGAIKPGAGQAVHYGMGALSGAVYGAMAEVAPLVATGAGLPFGVALWWIADESAVPALRLSKPADACPPSTHGYALASHLVYAVVTEMTRRALRVVL